MCLSQQSLDVIAAGHQKNFPLFPRMGVRARGVRERGRQRRADRSSVTRWLQISRSLLAAFASGEVDRAAHSSISAHARWSVLSNALDIGATAAPMGSQSLSALSSAHLEGPFLPQPKYDDKSGLSAADLSPPRRQIHLPRFWQPSVRPSSSTRPCAYSAVAAPAASRIFRRLIALNAAAAAAIHRLGSAGPCILGHYATPNSSSSSGAARARAQIVNGDGRRGGGGSGDRSGHRLPLKFLASFPRFLRRPRRPSDV